MESIYASHLRRLGALFYDLLIVVFVLVIFISGIINFALLGNVNEAEGQWRGLLIHMGLSNQTLRDLIGIIVTLATIYAYFAWTWTKYGQTIGLRTWKLKIQNLDGGLISLKQASIRFATAVPAWLLLMYGVLAQFEMSKEILRWDIAHPGYITIVGLLWLMWDSRPHSWRDRLSQSQVIRLA
jgi:uncharacterized RDD family membrane protein YckC